MSLSMQQPILVHTASCHANAIATVSRGCGPTLQLFMQTRPISRHRCRCRSQPLRRPLPPSLLRYLVCTVPFIDDPPAAVTQWCIGEPVPITANMVCCNGCAGQQPVFLTRALEESQWRSMPLISAAAASQWRVLVVTWSACHVRLHAQSGSTILLPLGTARGGNVAGAQTRTSASARSHSRAASRF